MREELCGPAASQQQITVKQTLPLPSDLGCSSFLLARKSTYPLSRAGVGREREGGRGEVREGGCFARSHVCIIPVLFRGHHHEELTMILSSRKTLRLTTNPERDKALPVPVLAYKPKQRAQLTRGGARPPTRTHRLVTSQGAERGGRGQVK